MHLFSLPREVIEEILSLCDPEEVAQVSQTSRLFYSIIYQSEDSLLWRNLYISQPFDDPRKCVSQQGVPRSAESIHWRTELQRIVRATHVATEISLCRPGEQGEILKTLLDMVSYAPPLTSPLSNEDTSNNLLSVAAILRHGFLDQCLSRWTLSASEQQILARLHTYYGLTQQDIKPPARVASRVYVYDMRRYRWENEFGPFDAEGRVNWLHVQALHHVVSMHVFDLDLGEGEEFLFALFPMSLPFTQVVIPPGIDLNKEQDWAGVSGSWRVSFCFCDHRELILFNESVPEEDPNGPLNPAIFEDPGFREVFRSLDVELRTTRTEPDPENPTRPIIFFVGEMRDPSTSTMTGRVKISKDGHIQWHFVSGDQGNAIWSSEGIQIGGVRSSYGVLGAWTTIFHDDEDPLGPFWLRKTAEV